VFYLHASNVKLPHHGGLLVSASNPSEDELIGPTVPT
jgi:hypothetical protein